MDERIFMKTRYVVAAVAVIGIVIASNRFELSVLKASAQERYSELQNFSKVLNLVQQYYVEEVDTKKLIYGAIKGMLRELDPHTNFLPPFRLQTLFLRFGLSFRR